MADVYMAGDLRNNTTFELEGNVFKVVEFQHVKPGKGAAFVRVKMKNVITGAVIERTFNPKNRMQNLTKHELKIKPNQDIVISGLGFLKFVSEGIVTIYTLSGVDVFVRDNLI